MSNTEFNATNGEQNSVQTLTSDNVAQENAVQSEAQKPLKLGEFLQSSDGKGLSQNDKGQFVPDNKQIKILVNCIDESTGELISLAKIDTSKVTSMKELFRKSERKDFSGIEKWDTSRVSTFASMFESVECFDRDISGWNVENAKSFYFMFWNASSFNQPIGAKWNTKSAEGMIGMFCQAKNFNNGGQPFGEKWVMDKVKWTWRMFWGAENFNQEINHWNVANVENIQRMFMNAKAFNKPLSKWNVSNVKNMKEMFNGAESFNQDLSAWGDKLGNVQTMKRMFANTKALDKNFLQDWQIPADCIKEHIIKGSKLEQNLKNLKVQNAENRTQDKKRKLKDIAKFTISQVKDSDLIQKICANLSENKGFVVNKNSWIPHNILNNYKVYLGKDEKNKDSKDEIIKADIDDFDYAFCRVFDDIYFIITIDDASPLDKVENINKFEIYQSSSIKEFNEMNDSDETNKYDKPYIIGKDNNLEFYLADVSVLIINKAQNEYIGDNSNTISDIINAYILAKAYKAKMQELNTLASGYKEKNVWGKILDFLFFWNSDVLHKIHKDICTFDLKYYQKDPVDKNKIVLDIWREMSKSYLVAQTHDELKETIKQVAELVSEENQRKFNYLMLVVAIFSAIGAILAAYPIIKGW